VFIVAFSFIILVSKTAFEKVKSLIQIKKSIVEEKDNIIEDLIENKEPEQNSETEADTEQTMELLLNDSQAEPEEEISKEEIIEKAHDIAEQVETLPIQEPISSEIEVTEMQVEETIEEEESTFIAPGSDEDLGLTVEEMKPEEESKANGSPLEILGEYDPKADLSRFQFPSKELLADHEINNEKVTPEELNENKDKIVETLKNYKIEITNISATIGPSITLYEIVPAPGVRISKIKNLEDDIALSLSALGIRIIAPMPGKGTVGIEVPNKNPQIVSMRSTIASKTFQESKYQLPIVLGKTIYNKTHVIDLAKTPHMLVAGATGQGKSVGINAILTSLLYKKHPAELKFVLIDPKKVELSIYSRIENHYLAKLPNEEEPIITDVQKVVATLNSLAKEMDARYDLLKNGHVRNIIEYNNKFINRKLNPDKGHRYLPYIVVVIDEFADLIMTAGKEVEHPIARIAQLARAIGIHLIVATQRPSTNVITGMIKANFPTRVAFRVTQMIDSRTILDSPGANQLIGRGDMLVSQGGGEMVRLQCPFVDTPEVEELVTHIHEQQSYPSPLLLPEPDAEALGGAPEADLNQRDELFEDAARLMVQTQQGSTSSIQRKFSIGYNRAGRIIDQLEAAGVVGPYEGSKARKVLYPDEYSLEQFLKTLA
jgi:S-DNA-T family DNA segregation ATPase FtsK/SpoIIIE